MHFKFFCCATLPDIRKNFFFKVPRFCPLFFVIKGTIKLKMIMEHWWNDSDRGKQRELAETFPITTLSTTDFTWNDLGSNPGPLRWGLGR
jgi:hypothetical protein